MYIDFEERNRNFYLTKNYNEKALPFKVIVEVEQNSHAQYARKRFREAP